MRYADLHIHSVSSDSTLNVGQIIQKAKDYKVDCISVTDHDTLDFYLLNDIGCLSEKHSLDIIPGIEFSCSYKDREVHLLGYFSDIQQIPHFFLDLLERVKQERKNRVFDMVKKLAKADINVDKEEFKKFIGDSCPCRLHLAVFLLNKKVVPTVRQAFDRYIGPDRLAFIPRFHYGVKESISILKQAGALVFLAHPFTLGDDKKVIEIISLGLQGLEVFYPAHNKQRVSFYKDLAQSRRLLLSGGSDAHGDYKKYTDIGCVGMDIGYALTIKKTLLASCR
jgi:3',5'-nucleoside bisphosphate phosphatase